MHTRGARVFSLQRANEPTPLSPRLLAVVARAVRRARAERRARDDRAAGAVAVAVARPAGRGDGTFLHRLPTVTMTPPQLDRRVKTAHVTGPYGP